MREPIPTWLVGSALAAAVSVACTKLDSPNDVFGKGAGGTRGLLAPAADGSSGAPDTANAPSGGSPSKTPDASSVERGGLAGAEQGRDGGAGSPSQDAGCINSSAWNGLGCYTCPPKDVRTLENACSSASCTPFDDARRLTKLAKNGTLPPLPSPATGSGSALSSPATGSGGASSGDGGTGVGGTTASGGAAAAGSGTANFACEDLRQRGQILYVTGSSAAKPFLQTIAQQIAGQDVFVVYTSTGSCVGVDAMVNGTPMTTGPSPAPAKSATYWDGASSSGASCDLPAAGVHADLGISDVFAQSCAGFELVSLDARSVYDAHGPIQTMTFVVPSNSRFSEISQQAAYFVFGFGSAGGVLDPARAAPIWDDEQNLYVRSAASGTQAMLAAAIGVPSGSWKGTSEKTSDDVAASIQAAGASAATADKAIGILAADYIDTRNLRAQIRVLAFQDTSQHCAVFPDSSATAHDKRNVRDGHYPIWGPLHLLYEGDQAGSPVNPDSRQALTEVIGYLSGTKALPNGVKLIDVYAQSGLVPECAMRVSRKNDGGSFVPNFPTDPCGCLFEAKATGATSCASCVVQGDCRAGETCLQGYCEQ